MWAKARFFLPPGPRLEIRGNSIPGFGSQVLRSWGLLHILKTADCQLKTADCRLLMSGHGLKAVAIQFLGFGSQVFALMWKL